MKRLLARASLAALLGPVACAPDMPPTKEPHGEHVYQLDYVITARDGSYKSRVDETLGDPGSEDVTRFTKLRLPAGGDRTVIEIRTLFHTEGSNILLDVAFEGGEKKERLHDREALTIPFDTGAVQYDLTITASRLR